jgi:MYXO-CTERM domain-containing protein
MKALALVLASHGVLFAANAYANPIMMEVARLREVPGPHIQLTYAVDSGKTPAAPSVPAIFGSKGTPWKTAPYRANTGSGVRLLNGIQMCDCNVPLGNALVYKFSVASAYDGKNNDYSLAVTPTGTGKYDAGVETSPLDASVMPWDIPDPVEIQGIDCTAECTAPQPLDAGVALDTQSPVDAPMVADVAIGTGGAVGSGGASGTGGIAGMGGATVIAGTGGAVGAGGASASTTKPAKSDDGGCSMGGSGSPGPFVVALIGLALIGRRKRRA